MPSAVGYQPTLLTEMGELQERITSTKNGSITSVQAIYVPADDYTDPAPATTFAHLDATTNLSRDIAALGIYPAVDPLASTSRILDPLIIGQDHYDTAQMVKGILQRYKDLQDIIAILAIDELSDEDKLTVSRPGKNGYPGVLPGHAPLLSQLGTGSLSDTTAGRKRTLSVQGGFVEVLPDHVRVLANIAERAEEIDIEKAKADLTRANDEVFNAS